MNKTIIQLLNSLFSGVSLPIYSYACRMMTSTTGRSRSEAKQDETIKTFQWLLCFMFIIFFYYIMVKENSQ